MPDVTALHPLLAACIDDANISQPQDAAWICAVLDRWSVPMFPCQSINNEQQVTFSEIFGSLETTRAGANGAGGKLIVLTTIGPCPVSVH